VRSRRYHNGDVPNILRAAIFSWDSTWLSLDDIPLYIIRQRLTMLYAADERFLEALAHAIECRKMLELWKDIPASKNYMYNLFQVESTIHKLYAQLDQLAESQHHGELCVAYAKQLRCEGRVTYLCDSLRGLS
jgi:hypothetical protein